MWKTFLFYNVIRLTNSVQFLYCCCLQIETSDKYIKKERQIGGCLSYAEALQEPSENQAIEEILKELSA